ncbi:hypothetical protein LINPERHAP2_LOCUS10384 [Linum perenne]
MQLMGEIDTKPIDSVQVALTLFEEKGDNQKKFAPTSSFNANPAIDEAMVKEKDTEELLKELVTYKIQIEAKDSEQMQLMHKLDYYQNSVEQLTLQLQDSESEKDFYIVQHQEATLRLNELELKEEELIEQAVEAGKLKEQLCNVLHELGLVQGEMLSVKAEHATLKDEKVRALARALASESVANLERGRSEELMKQVGDAQVEMALLKSELIKTRSKLAANEVAQARAKKLTNYRPLTPNPHDDQHNIIQGEDVGGKIMIPLADYEALVERASASSNKINMWKDYDQSASEFKIELANLKKELEGAMSKIGDMRTRAEQAVTRANAAERGRAEVEDELRKLKERKEKRKVALLALREQSLSSKFSVLPADYDAKSVEPFQPLGKILNLTY